MEITENVTTAQSRPREVAPDSWQAWAKVAVLFGLAVYFGYNIISGNLTNYVNIRFAWLSYIAVAIFVALGAASLYGVLRGDTEQQGVGFGHRLNISWGAIGIAALPLLLGTLVPSQPLGAAAVNGSISLSTSSYNSAAAFARDPLERNVLEWLRVFGQDVPSAFDGQEAEVIGFVYREPGFEENKFMVARFTMSCCVADASAIGFPVYYEGEANLADSQWIQVRGTFLAGDFKDTITPILQAETVTLINQPEHPYLYP